MTTPPVSTAARVCRFPGCDRAPADSAGVPGRPPEYCDDPEHTPLRAWRARRAGGTTGGPTVGEPADLGRPVAMAGARAAMLRDQLADTVTTLVDQLQRIAADMATMSDPDAAAAQIETVTSEAAEQVAAANGARSRAEAGERQARSERDEANAAAADVDEQLTAALSALAAAGEQRELDRADLATRDRQIDELTAQIDQVRTELVQAAESAAESDQRNSALTDALALARDTAAAATARAGELDHELAGAIGRNDQLAEDLAGARSQIEAHRAESARLEAQLAGAAQRADDAVARADRAEQARAQAEHDRADADRAAARLEAQLDQTRNRVTELADERTQLTLALTDATTRAARAEALVGAANDTDRTSAPRTPRARRATRPTAGPAGS